MCKFVYNIRCTSYLSINVFMASCSDAITHPIVYAYASDFCDIVFVNYKYYYVNTYNARFYHGTIAEYA